MTTLVSTIFGDRPIRRLAPYVYGILIIGLFLHPHFSAHLDTVIRPYVESLSNVIIVGLGALTFYLYKREEREHDERFLEASVHIGALNRKLPILQQVTTDLVSGGVSTRKQKDRVFQELIGIAIGSIAQSRRGVLRFIDTETGRTVKEFQYQLGGSRPDDIFTVGNKELLHSDSVVVSPERLTVAASDRTAKARGFLVVQNPREDISREVPLIRAVVDQGQILFRYYYGAHSV